MLRILIPALIAGSLLSAAHATDRPAVGREGAHHDDVHEDHLSVGEGLRVLHAWTRATDGRAALVFAEIQNESAAEIRLEGAETPLAPNVSLVGLTVKGAMLTFQALPAVPIPAGREMVLSPDGVAIRLSGLAGPLVAGETFPLHLQFSTGEMEIHVTVEAADATRHSHAGHAH